MREVATMNVATFYFEENDMKFKDMNFYEIDSWIAHKEGWFVNRTWQTPGYHPAYSENARECMKLLKNMEIARPSIWFDKNWYCRIDITEKIIVECSDTPLKAIVLCYARFLGIDEEKHDVSGCNFGDWLNRQ